MRKFAFRNGFHVGDEIQRPAFVVEKRLREYGDPDRVTVLVAVTFFKPCLVKFAGEEVPQDFHAYLLVFVAGEVLEGLSSKLGPGVAAHGAPGAVYLQEGAVRAYKGHPYGRVVKDPLLELLAFQEIPFGAPESCDIHEGRHHAYGFALFALDNACR